MSAQGKLEEKIELMKALISSGIQTSAQESKEEYKRITRENVNKTQTAAWYGSDDSLGQNTGLRVEDIIQVKNAGSNDFTVGFVGVGGHTSWVDGRSVDVIDILEEGGYTILAGGSRKPSINAKDDTFNYLIQVEGGFPRYAKSIVDLLRSYGFDVS